MHTIKRTVVLKVTHACNLACAYCYDQRRPPIKSDATKVDPVAVIEHLDRNLSFAQILFVLHGGEPLIIGPSALGSLARAMRKANTEHGHRFRLAVQTNGTLITDDFVRVFDEYRDLLEERGIGVSIDGPDCINDSVRFAHSGLGSSAQIMAGLSRLRAAGIDFGLLAVVGQHNVSSPTSVYKHLLSLAPGFIRFIPCHDIDAEGHFTPHAISPTEFARFLIAVFRTWLQDAATLIPVDPLVTIIAKVAGQNVSWCEYERESKCRGFVLIDHNGGLACCDNWGSTGDSMLEQSLFTVEPDTLARFFADPVAGSQIQAHSDALMQQCRTCCVSDLCCGGCLATRHNLAPHTTLAAEYCSAKRLLIEHVSAAVSRFQTVQCKPQTS